MTGEHGRSPTRDRIDDDGERNKHSDAVALCDNEGVFEVVGDEPIHHRERSVEQISRIIPPGYAAGRSEPARGRLVMKSSTSCSTQRTARHR